MKKFIVNEKSKQVMIENDVPEKLHNIVVGIIICTILILKENTIKQKLLSKLNQ